MSYVSSIYNALYIHVPKTGGTSISKALKPNFGRRGRLGHMISPEMNGEFQLEELFVFASVRHPVGRFESAYSFAAGGIERQSRNMAWSRDKRQSRKRDSPSKERDCSLTTQYNINEFADLLVAGEIAPVFVSWLPQELWLKYMPSGKPIVKPENLIRYGNIDADFTRVCGRFSPKPLKRVGVSPVHYKLDKCRHAQIEELYAGDMELLGY